MEIHATMSMHVKRLWVRRFSINTKILGKPTKKRTQTDATQEGGGKGNEGKRKEKRQQMHEKGFTANNIAMWQKQHKGGKVH